MPPLKLARRRVFRCILCGFIAWEPGEQEWARRLLYIPFSWYRFLGCSCTVCTLIKHQQNTICCAARLPITLGRQQLHSGQQSTSTPSIFSFRKQLLIYHRPFRSALAFRLIGIPIHKTTIPSSSHLSLSPGQCIMENSRSPRKLVGQPLLYAISVFASLGVFLVGPLDPFSVIPTQNMIWFAVRI